MVVSKNIDLEETLINHIQRLNLTKICVSLSGGLDSIVLLHILHQIAREQIYLRAIHFNHNLTDDSHSWAQFCKKICDQLKVNLDTYSLKINLHEQNSNFPCRIVNLILTFKFLIILRSNCEF